MQSYGVLGEAPTDGAPRPSHDAVFQLPLKPVMTLKPLICGAFALCTFMVGAQAQSPSRGASQPAGEASLPSQYKGEQSKGSVESRADVKAETQTAKKAGTITQGEQSTPRQGKAPRKTESSTSRADVKAEAVAANKTNSQPEGEESVKGQSKGVSK